ncbi:hypothetical protein BJG92_01286 [Arthrobacter sp. SO5]|uniref:flagellar hook-length control protein FliK n=1 Tax=Arthrobacter sp. SO5 TaxID=1897055 RepID=UPI001E369249|nr:flagellar hook-length control protein FliK [Arthrobacter sp. SO5]MCB5273762.1 hypothetical protein [Arthrobacter sp. SO5]
MKGVDLAATLAPPLQARGAQQGTRSRSEAGSPDAGSFDAVFNDVHSVSPGKVTDADTSGDGPADAAVQPSDGAAQPAGGASAPGQDAAAAAARDAAAFAGSAFAGSAFAGSAQVAASLEGTQQNVVAAALGLPATRRHEPSTTPAADVAATPGPDPRLAVPAALLNGNTQAATTAPPAAPQASDAATGQTPRLQPVTASTAAAVAAQQSAGPPPAPGTAAPLGMPAKGIQDVAPTAILGTAPSHVVAPALPATLATPVAPATPAAPATLAAPATPAAPAAPATPASPAAPAAPATPASPAAPAALAPAAAAVTAGSAAVSFAAVATAESMPVGPVRPENTPAATPSDALAAAAAATGAATPPTSQPTPAAAPSAAQPAAQAPSQPGATLQPQLAKPLFTLAGAPHGQHVMTLKVSPEDLGPMTVRAHIDAAGVRIELFAPGDAGREAIRGILPDLRKELAGAGFGASLDVSDHSGPGTTARDGTGQDAAGRNGSGRDGSGSGQGNRNAPDEPRTGHRWDALADGAALRNARILNGPQTTLDILA